MTTSRYSYHWSGLWLIATFPSRHYDIEMYPAVKDYLLSNFGMERLEQTGNEYIIKGEKVKARKKTNNKWFETQDSISYWEDFDKPKIIYPDIMRLPKSISKIDTYPNIAFDNDGYVPEATLFMMNGESIENICSYLTSDIGFFIFARFYMGPVFDDTGFRFKKEYLLKLPIPLIIKNANHITDDILSKYIDLSQEEMNVILSYKRNLIDFQ